MLKSNGEPGFSMFVFCFILLLFLAPFGFIKILEIIKYIITHLHWVP